MQRIRELFGVNHHLVAQANPHIIPFLDSTAYKPSKWSKYLNLISQNVGAEFRHRLAQVLDLGLQNTILFKIHSILNQTYVGDITIVPHIPWHRFLTLLSNPTVEMARAYMEAGEKAIWPRKCIHSQIMMRII
jgi:TAG lipase/steryl ester hydrolase/phospholipase A2/LPA acyltransferase